MATYVFTRTREQLQLLILRKLGALGAADTTAAAEDAAMVNEAMDLRLKELHSLGILWHNVAAATVDLALTSGVSTATISQTDYLFPITLNLRISGDDNKIEIIGHREYHAIQNKTDQGEPEKAYINGTTVTLWPVPDDNYTAKLTYEAISADTATSVAPDIRVDAMRSFALIVASDLADDFGLPEPKIQRLLDQSVGAMRTLKLLNVQRVDTTQVTPDYF